VIAAADPLLTDEAKFERGPAVRAVQFEEPNSAALGAERDEILAHDAQSPRQIAQILGQDDRLPEAP